MNTQIITLPSIDGLTSTTMLFQAYSQINDVKKDCYKNGLNEEDMAYNVPLESEIFPYYIQAIYDRKLNNKLLINGVECKYPEMVFKGYCGEADWDESGSDGWAVMFYSMDELKARFILANPSIIGTVDTDTKQPFSQQIDSAIEQIILKIEELRSQVNNDYEKNRTKVGESLLSPENKSEMLRMLETQRNKMLIEIETTVNDLLKR